MPLGSLGSLLLQADPQLKSLTASYKPLEISELLLYAEVYLHSFFDEFVDLNSDEVITQVEMVDALEARSILYQGTEQLPLWCKTANTSSHPNAYCYFGEVSLSTFIADALKNYQFSLSHEFDGSGIDTIIRSMNSSGPSVDMSDDECLSNQAIKGIHTTWQTNARKTSSWYFVRQFCVYSNNQLKVSYNGVSAWRMGEERKYYAFKDDALGVDIRRVHCVLADFCVGNEADVCATDNDGVPILYRGFQCSTGVKIVS
jgi:hypothetical protein